MKNTIKRYSFLTILILLLAVQFIRPAKNDGLVHTTTHISTVVPVSDTIETILQNSCYDCHSNQTHYPWYTQIQPIGFWLNSHVDEGKEELNFSEFATYKKKKQLHKLDECVEMIEENEMPLSSYTIVHQEAKLTNEQKNLLINWAKNSKQLLSENNIELH